MQQLGSLLRNLKYITAVSNAYDLLKIHVGVMYFAFSLRATLRPAPESSDSSWTLVAIAALQDPTAKTLPSRKPGGTSLGTEGSGNKRPTPAPTPRSRMETGQCYVCNSLLQEGEPLSTCRSKRSERELC